MFYFSQFLSLNFIFLSRLIYWGLWLSNKYYIYYKWYTPQNSGIYFSIDLNFKRAKHLLEIWLLFINILYVKNIITQDIVGFEIVWSRLKKKALKN